MIEIISIVVLLALVGYFVQKNTKLRKRILYLESQIEGVKNLKRSVSSTFMTHKPQRSSRPSNSYEIQRQARETNLESLMNLSNVVDPYGDRHAYSYDVDSMQKSIDSANISDSFRGFGGGFSGSGSGSGSGGSWSDSSGSSSSSSSSDSSSSSSSSSSGGGD